MENKYTINSSDNKSSNSRITSLSDEKEIPKTTSTDEENTIIEIDTQSHIPTEMPAQERNL